jgi:predicted esterase
MTGVQAIAGTTTVPARDVATNLLLHVPSNATPGEKLPTILYLHGGSHRGSDLRKLESYGLPRLIAEGRDLPFIVVAPQLAEGEIWSDADFLVALLDKLSQKYPIDPDRVYVTGISMGARGAWYLAFRHPDRIAAIAPIATFQPIGFWATSGRLRSIPVRAYHGDRDEIAPHDQAVRMHEALLAGGGRSELQTLVGRDHFIADVFNDPDLYRWLLGPSKGSKRRGKVIAAEMAAHVAIVETSWYQAAKLFLVATLGLSKDALHVHVGLGVFLLAALIFRRPLSSPIPVAAVILAALGGETIDMWDDVRSLGYWRWQVSLGDVVNTIFWPLVLWALSRWRATEDRSARVAGGSEEGVRSSTG